MTKYFVQCLFAWLLQAILFSWPSFSQNVSTPDTPLYRILILHSYDPSYSWTHDIQRGIEDTLQSSEAKTKFSIEYLDTKRIADTKYFAMMRHYLEAKYQDYPFDGVILTDDDALNFFNSLKMSSLRDLPTVAVGISDTSSNLQSITDNGMVIYEKDYLSQNLHLITTLRPHLKTLYYLADRSTTSNLIAQQLHPLLGQYPDIHLVEIRDLPLKKAQDILRHASEDDAVLLTHYNTELSRGIYHDYHQIAYQIGSMSQPPVFVLWKFYVEQGIVGGFVTDSYQLGRQAAQVILSKILSLSEPVDTEYKGEWVFDYSALLAHRIDRDSLPSDATLMGKPVTFFTLHHRVLTISAMIISLLIVIIVALLYLLHRKKEWQLKNIEIVALQKKTVSVQKELIHLLGDAIETRSGETGNHVKRVAKMSYLLAHLLGLSAEECEMIEIISPMHDIGKIGIPESILEKPGRLTEEEWTIMRSHVNIGFTILSASEGKILNYAAIIALEHHERWDGTGYPQGKAQENIHLYARITTVVDVFDALLSARCYKSAWPIEDVTDFFIKEQGKQFDPYLTTLLLDHLDSFTAIRLAYPDVPSHPPLSTKE